MAVRHIDGLRWPRLDERVTGLSGYIVAALELGEVWLERHRQRRRLATLPPYLLRDMGLSPADVARELDKPLWRP